MITTKEQSIADIYCEQSNKKIGTTNLPKINLPKACPFAGNKDGSDCSKCSGEIASVLNKEPIEGEIVITPKIT